MHDRESVGSSRNEPTSIVPSSKVKTLAWINAETRLPVKWQRESETRTFQFGAATSIAELPPEGKRIFELNTAKPPSPATDPLHSGPLLKRAPQNTSWEIKFEYGKDARSKEKPATGIAPPQSGPPSGNAVSNDPRPVSVKVTKTPDVLYEETRKLSGDTWHRWHYGRVHLEILQFGKNGRILALNSLESQNELVSTYEKHDFPDLAWISAGNYRAIQKIGEEDCLFFSDEVAMPQPTPPPMSPDQINLPLRPPPKVRTLVWVDALTRLPVKWQRESETRTFQFSPATPIPDLPPEGKHIFKLNTAKPPVVKEEMCP